MVHGIVATMRHMETPYGEIPDRFVRDMRPQEMHDFLRRRYGRRNVLKGAAALSVAAIAGPMQWRQTTTLAAIPTGPQWIAFGADPRSEMHLSWSVGRAMGKVPTPRAPQVRWGVDSSYGGRQHGESVQVPIPSTVAGNPLEPVEHTFYNSTLLSGLTAGMTYHYSVSNDGVTWSTDSTFTTAHGDLAEFRFTAFGDEAASHSSAAPMVQLVSALKPAFHLIAGDLAYATPTSLKIPDVAGFTPGQWDRYLEIIGPGARAIPWQAAVGAHEIEPLDDDGYAGFVTRFPQAYDRSSGSPVVRSFTYGNVAFVQLDGNDVSAQETVNTGYTAGRQTAWLHEQLAGYRSDASIDFIVAICNCCCYSTNQTHGSDGGLRNAWGPLFDKYEVDLVISGHVHAYERTNPVRAGQPTRKVASGGTVFPSGDGTTYICVGGGGNGLYTTWYGATDAGDAGAPTPPKVWRWSDGDTPSGGSGKPTDYTDTARGFSACRRAVFSCLVADVKPRRAPDQQASMRIRAVMPAQTLDAVTRIGSPTVIDSVTLVRDSRPGRSSAGSSAGPTPWLLGAAGGAAIAGGTAYVIRRRGHRDAAAAQDALYADPAGYGHVPPASLDPEDD
ncbi:MAG: metallophosphoesterase family protein [Actinomycetota bacterium]